MATGEQKWSAKGKKVAKFVNKVFPKGDYELRINAALVEQKISKDKPGSVPYINVPFTMLGTADSEGGKDYKLFHMLFLHLEPSAKDGKVMVERQGGVLDLAQAFGETPEFGQRVVPYQKRDAKGNAEGPMTKMAILDPKQVLDWVKSHDGATVTAAVKIEKDTGYGEKNKIDYFHPSADASEDGPGEEEFEADEDAVDEDAVEEDVEEAPEDEETEETEEEEPADDEEVEEDMTETFNPKAARAAAAAKAAAVAAAVKPPPSKVKQGPVGKGKGKK